jgi:hypothetical protein
MERQIKIKLYRNACVYNILYNFGEFNQNPNIA